MPQLIALEDVDARIIQHELRVEIIDDRRQHEPQPPQVLCISSATRQVLVPILRCGAGAGAQGHAARRGAGPLQGRWLGPGALCGLGRDPSISEESVHVGSWRTRPADPDPPAGPGPRSLPPPNPQLPDAAACNLDAEFPVGPVVLYCRLPQCFSSNFWVMSAQARCTRVRAGALWAAASRHTPHHTTRGGRRRCRSTRCTRILPLRRQPGRRSGAAHCRLDPRASTRIS